MRHVILAEFKCPEGHRFVITGYRDLPVINARICNMEAPALNRWMKVRRGLHYTESDAKADNYVRR